MRRLVLPLLLAACVGPTPGSTDSDVVATSPPGAPEGVRIEPAEPDTTSDLVVVVEDLPVDPDDDLAGLVIRWTRGDREMTALDDLDTVPAEQTRRGQRWTVSVAGVDDEGQIGPSTTAVVTITNLPPGAPVVSIFPDEPLAGVDDLVCSAQADDPDEDELTYAFRWERDGRVVEGARVAAEELVGKETWTCTATASDGRADGPPGTASVYVEAAPIPYFTLEDRNPTSPRYGRAVSPRDYLEKVSGWYFTHAT